MITELKIAGNYVSLGLGHLQIVAVDGSNLWEIEVQPGDGTIPSEGGSQWTVLGDLENKRHTASGYLDNPDYYASTSVNLSGRNASEVWDLIKQASTDVRSAGLSYEVLYQNSNTFVCSLLLAVGVDLELR